MKNVMKRLVRVGCMAVAVFCIAACDNDLDIQTAYPFHVETMPVPLRVTQGETVEIRCSLLAEGRTMISVCTTPLHRRTRTVSSWSLRPITDRASNLISSLTMTMTKRKRQPQRKEGKALRAGNNYQRTLAGLAIAVLLMLFPSVMMAKERMTELQRFNLAVEIIKHFEGWHTVRNHPYVGWGHQLQPGERYSARTMTKAQGDRLLRQDLMKMYRLFDGYGKDQMLLAVLAYNVGPYAILGTSKRPRSTLLKKLDAGNRNIFHDYMRFCRYKGRKVKSIERRRYVEFSLLFIQ